MEIRVRVAGRHWIVGNRDFTSLKEIRLRYGHRCVLIIER